MNIGVKGVFPFTEEINAFIEEKFKFIYDNIHPNCYKEINKIKKEIKSQVLQESKKAYTQGVESGYGKRKAEYRRESQIVKEIFKEEREDS